MAPQNHLHNNHTTEIVRSLFGSHGVSLGRVRSDYSCANGSYSGRMYVCAEGIAFYSNLFGFERKLYILWKNILDVRKVRTSGIAIECYYMGRAKNDYQRKIGDSSAYNDSSSSSSDRGIMNVQEHVFKSISHRDDVFDQIETKYKTVREIYDDVADDEDEIDLGPILDSDDSSLGKQESEARNDNGKDTSIKKGESKTNLTERTSSESIHSTSSFESPKFVFFDGTNDEDIILPPPTDFSKAWVQLKSSSEKTFKRVALKEAELPAFTLDSFYSKFFGDDADIPLAKVHDEVGDTVTNISKWKVSSDYFHQTRTITLNHPVIGYGTAKTVKHQHLRIYGENGIVIDSHVASEGVPIVKCFHVEERLFVEANADGGLSLTAIYRSVWTSGHLLKGIAEKGTNSATIQFYEDFVKIINTADTSGLPSVIVELQKEQEEEMNLRERTSTNLQIVFIVTIVLFFGLLRAHWKLIQLEHELISINEEVLYYRSQSQSCVPTTIEVAM